jgi:hypothetical protein
LVLQEKKGPIDAKPVDEAKYPYINNNFAQENSDSQLHFISSEDSRGAAYIYLALLARPYFVNVYLLSRTEWYVQYK